MEEKKEMKKLELVHQQSTYKMIIPQEVERKIRLLCREIHNVEWSGILFYKINGKFEDKSLVVTCIDLFQMDEGTGGYTEYDMNADVANYMVDHPELLEEGVYQGLIHSHNNMPTFFSGTDTATLQSEGSDMNHFVSLIVNNTGKYTAGITRKIKSKRTVSEKFSYSTWGDKVIEDSNNYEEEVNYIQWFNLNIEIESTTNNFEEEMLSRIKEIRRNKSSIPNNSVFNNNNNKPSSTGGIYVPIGQYGKQENVREVKAGPANIEKPVIKQPELPFNENEYNMNYSEVEVDPNIVDWIVKQTLTCSVLITNPSNVDKEKWVKSMSKLYKERFDDVDSFSVFASNFVDYILNFTVDPKISDYLASDEMVAVLAYNVNKELAKFPRNQWLDTWMSIYDDYII